MEDVLHERLAALSLEQKVRLLTGADFWSLYAEPAIGLRRIVMSDGPAGVRGELWDERDPAANVPSPTALAATWDVARGRAPRAPAGFRVPPQGRRRAPGTHREPAPLAVRRPPLRVLLRGPVADRRDRRRLRPRAAVRGRRRDGQALRRQRLRDRALHVERRRRRACPARALPRPVRDDPRRRAVGDHGRLQRRQRRR